MDGPGSTTGERSGVGWAMRHYAAVVVMVFVLAAAVATAVTVTAKHEAPYEADTLVVANDIRLRPEQVPRFAESVFASGSVARKVAFSQGLDQDYRTLVPDVVRMEPVPESITFLVVARDDEAVAAAKLADAAAAAFVEELNEAGQEVGRFSVLDEADEPLSRVDAGPSPALAVVISAAAAGAVSLALVWTLLALRRPLLLGQEAARVAEAPLLSEVHLRSGSASSGRQSPGIRRLAVALMRDGCDAVVLAGPEQSERSRWRVGEELVRAFEKEGSGAPLVLHDPEALGRLHTQDRPPCVVLVVHAGTPAAALETARLDFLDDELAGVVLVRGRARGSGPRPVAPAPAEVPATTRVRRAPGWKVHGVGGTELRAR